MHITLTGNLGSGKSTISKLLSEKYGFEIFSTGKVIRQIADDLGISVLEMNELMSRDSKYDHMIDDKTAAISRENPDKNILFDSRLAWNFVEKSFKVFLSVDLSEAARRVYADASRGEVETYKSEADAAEQLAARAANEDARYEELYGIHYFDFNNYNLILDSSYATPEVIAALLMREVTARASENPEKRGQMFISPKRLDAVIEAVREYSSSSIPFLTEDSFSCTRALTSWIRESKDAMSLMTAAFSAWNLFRYWRMVKSYSLSLMRFGEQISSSSARSIIST